MGTVSEPDGGHAEVPAAYRKPDYTQIAQLETELGLPHSAPVARVLLTRDMILKADNLRTEEVPVPEWGGSVLVRELRGRERDEWEASLAVQRGKQMVPDVANMRAKLVARSVVGEDGEPVFTQQDVAALGELSAAALDRVFEVASRLSGLSETDLDEMGKASENGRDAGSSSA
jgi:hypothetical protein